jgi:hypothetical protein
MTRISRTPFALAVALAVSASAPRPLSAQDVRPLALTEDAKYYDFWVGTWYKEVDGRPDTSSTSFRVVRDVHPAAFHEEWRMVVDPTTRLRASAIRAWDKTAGRWMYVWVSDNGLFQVWEGRKVGDQWYIYRPFDVEGDKYLSRQAWIPEGPDRLMRVSEKSYDDGRSWQLRFREYYRRVSP